MSALHFSAIQRKKAVLTRVSKQARPLLFLRLEEISRKLITSLRQETPQKIHVKMVLKGAEPTAIEVSSAGLLALEYGREISDQNGPVSKAIRKVNNGYVGVDHDE
ncbi:MAG: hypothetical protein ABJO09_07075 [Hyphomicrobiales bacterium]